ncbi:alpha/beta fold hydrolase [Actinomadura madurae]|uniref:alpha/beta fold hydrolase n=2 Tax=Actinomadura madurae TaxID=1993 RepID=UPI00202669FB|nr:alpha/beta hydrolase [Actinomadura madurae]MCP9984673.1 alpha/beta hydrolase [Actinomadura madurae]URN00886.1 alpha/beta hydrolase [Actinomadura madurae]URN03034.1 alpha/beta hydrolase [Actinomadura madurae]
MTISDRRDVLKGALLAATAAVPVAVPLMARPAAAAGPARDPLKPEPVPEQVPVTEGFVEVPGGRLWYWDTGGTGSPVVLLHPGTGSALAWPYQQPVLARGGHRVVAYSRRGHYRSSPATPEDQPAVADLLALADHLDLGRFHLVGAALGGFVATDFAVSHPRRLRSLALVNSQIGIQETEFRDALRRLQPPGADALPHSFRELGPSYRATNPQGVHEWEEIVELSRPGPASPFPKLTNRITWDVLRTMRTRTLLTMGDADLYIPPSLGRTVLEHLPNASSLTFAEVGHSPQWERPSVFNRKLLQFLRGARFTHGTLV